MVYYANVQSLISYGILFWGATTHITKVFVLQKRALRIMLHLGRRVSCRPYFKEIKILTVACLYMMEVIMFVHDFPTYFIANDGLHRFNTRGRLNLHQVGHRLKLLDNDPVHMGVKIFNKLPDDIKQVMHTCSRETFKLKVKSFFLEHGSLYWMDSDLSIYGTL
jgi:hypothetical protein